MSEQPPNWERSVLEKLALSAIQEQRRTRHWGILFKTLTFLYLFIVLFLAAGWFGSDGVSIKEHTALVDLQGVIASDQASADSVIGALLCSNAASTRRQLLQTGTSSSASLCR